MRYLILWLVLSQAFADVAVTSIPSANLRASGKANGAEKQDEGIPMEADVREQRELLSVQSAGADSQSETDAAMQTPTSAPDRELVVSTKKPLNKLILPIVGGVVGAGALAGVITVSVLKNKNKGKEGASPKGHNPFANLFGRHKKPAAKANHAFPAATGGNFPQTTLTTGINKGATHLPVGSTAGFSIGDSVILSPGTAQEETAVVAGFGSIILSRPTIHGHPAGAVVQKSVGTTALPVMPQMKNGAPAPKAAPEAEDGNSMNKNTYYILASFLGACALCLGILVCVLACMGKKSSDKKKRRPSKETNVYPEENMPLASAYVGAYQPDYLIESQYLPVQAAPVISTAGYPTTTAALPTMSNVIPMQTMPPSQMYTQGYTNAGAYAAQASPLANTVNALPSYYPAGAPTTFYG
jgi:hypothetical protein